MYVVEIPVERAVNPDDGGCIFVGHKSGGVKPGAKSFGSSHVKGGRCVWLAGHGPIISNKTGRWQWLGFHVITIFRLHSNHTTSSPFPVRPLADLQEPHHVAQWTPAGSGVFSQARVWGAPCQDIYIPGHRRFTSFWGHRWELARWRWILWAWETFELA